MVPNITSVPYVKCEDFISYMMSKYICPKICRVHKEPSRGRITESVHLLEGESEVLKAEQVGKGSVYYRPFKK